MDLKFFQNLPAESLSFIENLKLDKFNFVPVTEGCTRIGSKINMGYICYAVKIYKMTNQWESFSDETKKGWINKLNSYQIKNRTYENYFIDPEIFKYFNNPLSKFNIRNYLKSSANLLLNKNYENRDKFIFKTINADNKQTISTLGEVGSKIKITPSISFNNHKNIESYLDSYDWSKPWDAGAQFSSLALYNNLLKLQIDRDLEIYIEKKINNETGSYFSQKPNHDRQIINGAMKVITGLDWLNIPIHLPEKLIDFCINNKPQFEGCDLVDYVYVLYRCSLQTNHRKEEVKELFIEISEYLKLLYHPDQKGFSYFIQKSQTHYYGLQITKGVYTPDIHGTILSIWAIVMILESLQENIYNYKLIKP